VVASAAWRAVVQIPTPVDPSHGLASSEEKAMPIIKANSGIITQINVFTVSDGGQQSVIDLLAESARYASGIPGWLSASLHRSRDGTKVVNYAQSESPEAAQLIMLRPSQCRESIMS
jgi:hypothetical protein